MDNAYEPNANDAPTNDAWNVDLRCIIVSKKALKWTLVAFVVAILVIGVSVTLVKLLPKHKSRSPPLHQGTESWSPQPDQYTEALHKALLFFNAQKSGKLPDDNGITWRRDSGLEDGSDLTEGDLVGGYYDAGDNTKFHFPMSFAMTMLSWNVLEYGHKYKSINEYDHTRELIKWGTDYLLHTSGADLAGELTAALAAASIVFKDDTSYSKKLLQAAATVWAFTRDPGKRSRYSRNNLFIAPYYNSTGYYDEYLWGGAWMYYATGNSSYLRLLTPVGLPRPKVFTDDPSKQVLSWDNKLPAVMLLLTRLRVFRNPGIKYITGHQVQNLQYVVNAVFLASLYVDYWDALKDDSMYCGSTSIPVKKLREFAISQMNYILGKTPMTMSYVVGHGKKYPTHVHHRGASIPNNDIKYSCKGGFQWMSSSEPNPNIIMGAMVGGPDERSNSSYTEPTLAGNAGLVAALVLLIPGNGIDEKSIMSEIPSLYLLVPPPPPQNPNRSNQWQLQLKL
ncbi:endoglucanase 12-like protein [Tanacetum coccineum]